ncbi:MAG: TIR domain-containing protein [Sphingomicrobium sp.]
MNKWTRRLELSRASAGPAAEPNAPLTHHYFAFLSYSHTDSAQADWLHKELERFRVPSTLAGRLTGNGVIPKRLTPIFRDRHELAAGENLTEEIRVALTASRCLIVLCSPAAAKSRWTNEEIEFFKRAHPDGCVIAAIVGGEPGREAQSFPAALTQRYDRRGRPTGRSAEPLAADLRPTGDGRRSGLLKIVAGILGVGLDDLVQRDELRRQRRLAAIAGGSFLGMIVAGGLAVTAIQARDAARDQRRQAESLVEFMVGDLRDKLEPIGKLDVLDGVGSRVLAYYSRQDTADLSDDALLQRSRALNLMAEVAYNRGNIQEAADLYRQAMAGTAEALRRSPDDARRLYEHAQNVFYVGEMARFSGQPVRSEAAYREYKRLADRMVEIEPDNVKYRMEVLYANEDLGISLVNERRFAEAEEQFESVAGPIEKLASLYPDNATYQYELGNVLDWLADSQRSQGKLPAAVSTRRRQIAFLDSLVANGAGSNVKMLLIKAHARLGYLLTDLGDYAGAAGELNTAVSEADALITLEPTNALWKSVAAAARLDSSRVLIALGQRDRATAEVAAGCALALALPAAPGDTVSKRDQTACLMMQSKLALLRHQHGAALDLAGRALTAVRKEHSEDPIMDRYRVADIYRLMGDIKKEAGDLDGATAEWNTALAQFPANVAERPTEMSQRAELLRRLGRLQEAQPIAARLAVMKFRGLT